MKFEKGQSGNPTGRPYGSLNKSTQLMQLIYPHAEALIEKVISLALSGDIQAIRLCIERLLPRAKNETINLSMENLSLTKAKDLPFIVEKILLATSNQQLTPEQAKIICDVIETQRKLIETSELQARVGAIEHVLSGREGIHNAKFKC